MMKMILILWIPVPFMITYVFFKIREFDKRVSGLELSATRELIGENDGDIIESVLKTQNRLYNSGGFLEGREALAEAKKLHGLK